MKKIVITVLVLVSLTSCTTFHESWSSKTVGNSYTHHDVWGQTWAVKTVADENGMPKTVRFLVTE